MDSEVHTSRLRGLDKAHKEKKRWFWILLVIILIPVVCLCGLCLYKVIQSALIRQDAKDARKVTETFLDLDILVQAVLLERGFSNGYLRSGGTQRVEALQGQRNTSDAALAVMDLSKLNLKNPEINTNEKFAQQLAPHRKKVWAQELTFYESNSFYIALTDDLIEVAESVIHLPEKGNLWPLSAAAAKMIRATQLIANLASLIRQPLIECNQSRFHLDTLSKLDGGGTAALRMALKYYPPLAQNYKEKFEDTPLKPTHDYVRALLATDQFVSTCLKISDTIRWQVSFDWFQSYFQHYLIVRDLRGELMVDLVKGLDELVLSAENDMLIYIIVLVLVLLCSLFLILAVRNVSLLVDQVSTYARRGINVTYSLEANKKKAELLLSNMMPGPVAHQLMQNQEVIPRYYESATICYLDLHGFLKLTSRFTVLQLGQLLSRVSSLIEDTSSKNNVYKLEHVSTDTFVLSSGVPEESSTHPVQMADFALEIMRQLKLETTEIQIKIGIHTGPVAAGVIGRKVPRYSVFGESVKMAERMCRTSPVSTIQLSHATKHALQKLGAQYNISERGQVDLRGIGTVKTYTLN